MEDSVLQCTQVTQLIFSKVQDRNYFIQHSDELNSHICYLTNYTYVYQFEHPISGGQPSGWQHRYSSPSGTYTVQGDRGSWGPHNGPRPPPPPGQWGPQGDRSGSFPAYGAKPMVAVGGSWGPSSIPGQPGMRPPYRPDMRGPGPVPRPVRY